MKAKFPKGYGKYLEYDFDNRITYDEDSVEGLDCRYPVDGQMCLSKITDFILSTGKYTFKFEFKI